MTVQRGDEGFFVELRRRLYSAVLSDVLDELGLTHQAMTPRIRPLDEDLVLVGIARTGLFREVDHVTPGENPYELEIRIIDDLKPGEVDGVRLRRLRPHRTLGRAADHRGARSRRRRRRDRRIRARRARHPRA